MLSREHLADDLRAGVVVFLVALPLCLGIALASGAPLFSGLIAGISGGIVVTLVSQSRHGVSGPAAGLTVIIYDVVQRFGLEALGVIVLGYRRRKAAAVAPEKPITRVISTDLNGILVIPTPYPSVLFLSAQAAA